MLKRFPKIAAGFSIYLFVTIDIMIAVTILIAMTIILLIFEKMLKQAIIIGM